MAILDTILTSGYTVVGVAIGYLLSICFLVNFYMLNEGIDFPMCGEA